MVTIVPDNTNATSTSATGFARQQNSTAANVETTVGNQGQTRLVKPVIANPYGPRKSTNPTSTVQASVLPTGLPVILPAVLTKALPVALPAVPPAVLPEDIPSPDEETANEWHALKEYDLPNTNTDLFDNIDPTVLADLAEAEEDEEDPALISYEQEKKEAPSEAMRNLQRSIALLTDAERRTLLQQQVTPSTAGLTSISRSRVPAMDISEITDPSTVNRHFMPELATPKFHTFELPVYQNQAIYDIVETDPLEAIMSQPRLSILQDLIRDLAASSLAATDALENKTLAAARLHDPSIESTPRSVRQKDFTLTTIKEFQGHQIYKQLVMKVAGLGAQYRKSLTDTIKELATHECTWLKLLRVQQTVTALKPILASLIFRVEAATQRPSLPTLVSPNTLQFFVFYWMLQMNVKLVSQKQTTKCFLTFFDLPFNDIAATAANMLVENSPQAIANIIAKLNSKEMEWDVDNQATGHYINTILRDLHAIVSVAVIDHVTYQKAQKNAKIIEAKTIAFVNKVRVKNTTALTQASLDKVVNEERTATVNEKDYLRRQQELEALVAGQKAEFQAYVKSQQQKNSQGSSSAQWPQDKHKQKPAVHRCKWTPPQTTVTKPTVLPNSLPKPTPKPDYTIANNPNSKTEASTNSTNTNTKRTKNKHPKKRKISQKK